MILASLAVDESSDEVGEGVLRLFWVRDLELGHSLGSPGVNPQVLVDGDLRTLAELRKPDSRGGIEIEPPIQASRSASTVTVALNTDLRFAGALLEAMETMSLRSKTCPASPTRSYVAGVGGYDSLTPGGREDAELWGGNETDALEDHQVVNPIPPKQSDDIRLEF
uniref:Uncharacterized protein n=1 Tax=Chromera velia CCMP2878 TaxID=1169474 RepID=A0A0G4HGT4_9ALVE|eukprot:Cvel_27441.t1-p1 / transcript=Cvel_27441.t1 / gene=Cvel_27441 / organism=Chromera_velia_CCMP2878 / gene_product=hypothetical protein / transcript_product=hypothetical protein / location=Cvel_scaffold3424:7806-10085(-) / protein_length=165 / sequence_SO=supercontig / SO=protein_coding / is_pseudo=false